MGYVVLGVRYWDFCRTYSKNPYPGTWGRAKGRWSRWSRDGSCGPHSTGDQASQGGPGSQVVGVVRVVTLDDMLSENIWFSCPKSSNN